ncbi:class I SAM-dependent methyltransferase [Hyphomicrobium sp. B1]|uniref:class I SAM-dependent methyltransferase n=1 Tax=Hyphomicrobium sp. B1 TaxID=3075651 RepID=UPI003C2BCC53
MLSHVTEMIGEVERDPSISDFSSAVSALRAIGLDDFGRFFIELPNPAFPKLSSILPRMASNDVQRNWTGQCGVPLLKQSLAVTRSMSSVFAEITGSSLSGKRVLDFGCGYGRLARLMFYFTDHVEGVDPWSKSIEICQDCGLDGFKQSDYLPSDLPFPGGETFDLIYAFSVFTHLSKRATLTALKTLRNYVSNNGVLMITIRPVEYWDAAERDKSLRNTSVNDCIKKHDIEGFCFVPHDRPPVDGDVTYGDTSMTLEWLRRNNNNWEVAKIDRSIEDTYQIYVYLTPASL